MKQILVSVEEKKYKFLIEVLKHFDFVKIEDDNITKKELLKEISEGMYKAHLATKGKAASRSAKSFLHEL